MAKELSMLETSPPPGAQVITCRVVGWRLAAKMCTSQGIAISSLRWRWRRQQEERGLRRAHLPGYSQDATSWRLETLNVSSILTSLQILMAEMRSEVAAPQEAVMDAVLIKNLSRLCRQQVWEGKGVNIQLGGSGLCWVSRRRFSSEGLQPSPICMGP